MAAELGLLIGATAHDQGARAIFLHAVPTPPYLSKSTELDL
jgi:hypothetical protein